MSTVPPPTTDTAPPPDCSTPFSCTAGAGAERFQPIDGDDLVMVHGPQGGWHIETAVRLLGTTEVVRLRPEITVLSTGMSLAGASGAADTVNQALAWDPATCVGETWGLFAYLDDPPDFTIDTVCALAGEPLQLTLHVQRDDGQTTTCSTTGIATLDPDDIEPCESVP